VGDQRNPAITGDQSNCRHISSKGCLIAKSRLRYTVHCDRLGQNCQVPFGQQQTRHCPRFTSCCHSDITTPASSRTVCSSSCTGAICCPLRSGSASFSRYSKVADSAFLKRYSRLPMRLYGMRRKGQRSVGNDFTLYDRSTRPISSPPQPLTSHNQALGVVLLLDSTGAAVHDAHGQRRHITVEPG
jgi:hypothetical protein